MKFCCILCVSLAVMIGPNLWAADAPESSSTGKATPGERISTFDLKFQQQIKRSAWVDGPLPPRFTSSQGLRRSVGSALSPEAGIGKGASVDLTWDDAQYKQGQGRHIAHWWNGEYGESAEISVHFGYRNMPDSSQVTSPRYSGYNVYDAVGGTWPRGQDVGCDLQSADTIGWGGMPSLDIMPDGRVVMGAMSHLSNGFLGDSSAFVDNMFFYQGSEFSCTYGPGLNTTFIDSLVYRPHFLDQSEGNYSRNPQVVTQWDGANTIVHVLLMEELGTPLSGYDYVDGLDYYTCTYYRKVGETADAGTWSAGQVIDSLWFPWPSMAAAPFPHEGIAISYTNPSYYGGWLNNPYDLDVWYRESLDRGLTWQESQNISYQLCGEMPCDPPAYANWLESQPLYSSDGDLHVIMTGTPTSPDPYYDGFDWIGWNSDIYHWAKSQTGGASINHLTKVANGTYPDGSCWPGGSPDIHSLHCGFGGINAMYIANINISECDEKLYCIWNQIHERANHMQWQDSPTQPAPGVLDDCARDAPRLSSANWEIMMSVTYLADYVYWDKPRNVSDTYTPNCGLPGDPQAEGICASDYKPSVERYGMDESGLSLTWPAEATIDVSPGQDYAGTSYLHLQYLDDQFPAPSMWSSRRTEPRTLNSIKWMRLACVDPIYASEIQVLPDHYYWPTWVELGQVLSLYVTIVNNGNIPLNVTEIGFDDGGDGWLSVSENPTPATPLVVTSGTVNTLVFEIYVDATGIAMTQWLDGEVWLKSDAINEDSTPISIHLLAAADVEPVVWDTVQSHQNMFDMYYLPDGECVALAVGNNGEVGWGDGTSGSVNLDYVESETECGGRFGDGIYLRSGSAFTILADDAAGANARLTSSHMDANQGDPNGWDPVGEKGSIAGGLSATGLYDSVYTGQFVNRDTSIAMERIYYAPRSEDPDNEIINFVICYTKLYSGDGAGHNHVTVGNVVDWDVPSEDRAENTSGLSGGDFVYVRGTDTTGVLSCQTQTRRYAAEVFGGGYTSVEVQANQCTNDSNFHSVHALNQLLMEDTSHYRDGTPLEPWQPNPLVWWEQTGVPGLNPDTDTFDQAIWLTYVHDYNLDAEDTLHYWTVLTTVRDGTVADLEEQVRRAECWFLGTIRPCTCSCCEGRVGDCNGLGGDEPTIGDVSVMIDAKFISGTCAGIIECLAECDINQSGGKYPDCHDITIGDISGLIDYLFITGKPLGLNDCL